MPEKTGRPIAWTALLLGAVMSVAANALHVVQVTGPASTEGVSAAQVIGAAFWPVALLISVEVIARVAWPDGVAFVLLRWGGVGAVALVAAIVSYGHMHGLLLHWGEAGITALLGPVGVDGLVTVGASALMAIGHQPTVKPTAAPVKDRPEPAPAPAPAPAPIEVPSPVEPEPVAQTRRPAVPEVTPEPSPVPDPVPPVVDLSGLRLPESVTSKISTHLSEVMAAGQTPTAEGVAAAGRVPASIATKVLTHLNGSLAASS